MPHATIVKNEVPVTHSVREDLHREFLRIDCPEGWDAVKKLTKKVLEYNGKRFTYSGWNSDRNECYFVRTTWDDVPQPTARILNR